MLKYVVTQQNMILIKMMTWSIIFGIIHYSIVASTGNVKIGYCIFHLIITRILRGIIQIQRKIKRNWLKDLCISATF